MRAIRPLVKRNLRRGRGQLVATTLLVVIAAMLLDLAFMLALGYSRTYDKMTEDLRTPQAMYLVPAEEAAHLLEQHFTADARVSDVEVTATRFAIASLAYNGSEIAGISRFDVAGQTTRLDQSRVVETLGHAVENPIYGPLILKYGGYSLGDPITLQLGAEERTFHLAAFVESPARASMTMGVLGFELPADAISSLDDVTQPAWAVSAMVPDRAESDAVTNDGSALLRQWGSDNRVATPILYDLSGDLLKAGSSMGALMFAVLLSVFGLILTIVVIVAVTFMIRQTVARDMPAVGSLKSSGFTSRQIVSGIVGQYAVAALAAIALGVGLAVAATPIVRLSLEGQTGLSWNPGFDPGAAAGTLAVLLGTVAVSAALAAGTIRRTPPVDALRGGVATHAFRTNPLPLAETRGSLDVLLGAKSILRGRGRAAATAGLIAIAAFASTFTVALQTHILGDPQAFVRMVWGMDNDLSIRLAEGADTEAALAVVKGIDGVEMATYYENFGLVSANRDLMVHVTPDFSLLRYSAIFEGRAPVHANEAALGANASDALGVRVGDTVTMTRGDTSMDYLVTGLTQSGASLGMDASLTSAGYDRVDPGFVSAQLTVDLQEGTAASGVITAIRDALGTDAMSVANEAETMNSIMAVWITMSQGLSVAILVLTAAVIVLVLGLVVASHQTARRREVGILRALGFSRRRIARQTAAAHLPVVGVGLVLGLVAGAFLTGPLLGFEMSLLGMRNMGGAPSPGSVVALGIGMLAISGALLAWMGRNTGRLTSRELISE